MYIYVNHLITVSHNPAAGTTITDDPADLIRDLSGDSVIGAYSLTTGSVQGLIKALEDGSAVAAMGTLTDADQDAVKVLHAALVQRQADEKYASDEYLPEGDQ